MPLATSVHPHRIALLALCITSAIAPAAQGGVILKTLERDATGKDQTTTTLSVEDGKLLIENMAVGAQQANDVVIFKEGVLIAVDHERKSYTVFDKATMQSVASSVNKAMAELEQKMAQMTPEQRAMVEKMMGKEALNTSKPAAPAIQFKNTGKREKAGKYDCALWQAEVNGQVRWQHCVVPFGQVEGGEEMVQVMKKMSAMVEDITKSMNANWMKSALDAGWEGIRNIDGYPVLTRGFSDGKPDSETILVSSQKASIDAARFEPPAGYKQQQLKAN